MNSILGTVPWSIDLAGADSRGHGCNAAVICLSISPAVLTSRLYNCYWPFRYGATGSQTRISPGWRLFHT
jgi:hypothetical protein